MDIYGSEEPPSYDLGKVSAPVALYFGDNGMTFLCILLYNYNSQRYFLVSLSFLDWLANRKDVLRTISELPNIVDIYEVPYTNFNHMDFLYGMDVGTVLYPELLTQMSKALDV